TPDRSRSAKARCSALQVSVSRVITGPDRPAEEPRNWPSAGTKSPDDRPCRYSTGSTSVIFGVFRAHGGKIAEPHRFRSHAALSAVAAWVRVSLPRGTVTSTEPALVSPSRLWW